MKNVIKNLGEATREEFIAMLQVIDGKNYSDDTYKGKRAKTLQGIVESNLADTPSLIKTLADKGFRYFPVETAVVKKDSNKSTASKISEMTPEQIISTLTPNQEEVLDDMMSNYDTEKNEVLAKAFMPEGREAFRIGGVLTTLIEKGIFTKNGSGKNKKFVFNNKFESALQGRY